MNATVLSPTSIMVTWDIVPPVDQNGIITTYEILYIPQEDFGGEIGAASERVPASNMSFVLRNLEEYVNYNISVQANTRIGPGPYSDPVIRLTFEDGKSLHLPYFSC